MNVRGKAQRILCSLKQSRHNTDAPFLGIFIFFNKAKEIERKVLDKGTGWKLKNR